MWWSLAADQPPGRVDCLINNLNDAVARDLFPILFSTHHLSLTQIGLLGALYPASWGIAELGTGALSDRIGRKWLISTGMLVQAGALALVASSTSYGPWIVAVVLLGLGTAMVHPTLLAAVGDVAHPIWRSERSVSLPALARCRVRRRRAARGSDRRPVGPHHGGLGRGRAHRRVQIDRRRSHVRDPLPLRAADRRVKPPARWMPPAPGGRFPGTRNRWSRAHTTLEL
jgi:hypothetical protein